MLKVSSRIIGKEIVEAKLLMAAPRILEQNRLMVTTMLEEVKKIAVDETPIGPGHFGYHLKDSFRVDVQMHGVKTVGVLKAPAQGYWREYGTLSQFRKGGTGLFAATTNLIFARAGARGEPALMIAHKALAAMRRFIKFYYGNAQWWRV